MKGFACGAIALAVRPLLPSCPFRPPSFPTSKRSLIGLCLEKFSWPTSWLIPPSEAVDIAVAGVSAIASVCWCVWGKGKRKRGLDMSFRWGARLVFLVRAIDPPPIHVHSPCLCQGHVEHGEAAHAQARRDVSCGQAFWARPSY